MEKERLQTEALGGKGLIKMRYMQGSIVAMQHGRKSELSFCLCTNYPALLRFGKVNSACETGPREQ